MRIIIYAIGSRGDVQPYIALALGLKEQGHQVVIGTETAHKALLDVHGIEHVAVEGSMEWALANSEPGRQMNGLKNPFKALSLIKQMIYPLADQWNAAIIEHTKAFDFVVHTTLSILPGLNIMRKFYPDKPFVCSFLFPVIPTREFGPPTLPGDSNSWFKWMNSLKWKLADKAGHSLYDEWLDRQRAEFELAASQILPYDELLPLRVTVLNGFSSTIVAKPVDWDENQHVTGQFVLRVSDYEPPTDLEQFLQAGPAPVYIGFGSMLGSVLTDEYAIEVLKNCLRAVRACGWRAILCIRSFETLKSIVKNNDGWLHFLDAAPHDWLFPRCRIVVHHGGAGTTHTATLAAVPSVIVSCGVDQNFWSYRLYHLGCGPEPLTIRSCEPADVHRALLVADSDACRTRVKQVSEEMRKEEGVKTAVRLIESVKSAPKWN